MTLVRDLFDKQSFGQALDRSPGLPTGLSDLDSLTLGIQPGTVWLVVGPHGVGRTLWATQLAAAAAYEMGVLLLAPGESEASIILNIVSAQAVVARHRLRAHTLTQDDQLRLLGAQARIRNLNLEIHDAPQWHPNSVLSATNPPGLLVVDNADLCTEDLVPVLSHLRSWAQRTGCAVVLTIPEDVAAANGWRKASGMPSAWSRPLDVAIRLERPDQHERDSPRAGEIDLIVERHRDGPEATITVAFQGHYSRLVDFAVTPLSSDA